MIKCEFKISSGDGHDAYVERMIESQEDYLRFKLDVISKVVTLDELINKKLKQIEKNGHDKQNIADARYQPAEVQ